MIYPTRQLVTLTAAGFIAALLPIFAPALWIVWALYTALVVLLCGADLILARRASEVRAQVTVPKLLALGGEAGHVTLVFEGAPPPRLELTAAVEGDAEHPPTVEPERQPDETIAARVPLRPTRRGTLWVERLDLRWTGPLGLWWRDARRPVQREVPVVTDLGAVRRGALNARTHHAHLLGAKQRRYIGDGSEFEALREYVPGLDTRGVDWRATARTRKLMVREHRAERNHRVILAIDTGNLMGETIEGVPRLDHAIHAGLMLAYTSLKMGDQVGLFAFDAEPRAFVEPRHGAQTLHRLIEHTARLETVAVETNFTLALTELASRHRRRSVVVILTDFVDTVSAELMVEHTRWLARRHLVLFVAIADPELAAIAAAPPEDELAVHRAVIADQLLRDRALVLARLRRAGVFCIDAAPQDVSVRMINHYLEIHRRELV